MSLDLEAIRAGSAGRWQPLVAALIAEIEEARRRERTAWRNAEAVREQAARELAEADRRTAMLVQALEEARSLLAPLGTALASLDGLLQRYWEVT